MSLLDIPGLLTRMAAAEAWQLVADQRMTTLESKVAALESWRAVIDPWKASTDTKVGSIDTRLVTIEGKVAVNEALAQRVRYELGLLPRLLALSAAEAKRATDAGYSSAALSSVLFELSYQFQTTVTPESLVYISYAQLVAGGLAPGNYLVLSPSTAFTEQAPVAIFPPTSYATVRFAGNTVYPGQAEIGYLQLDGQTPETPAFTVFNPAGANGTWSAMVPRTLAGNKGLYITGPPGTSAAFALLVQIT